MAATSTDRCPYSRDFGPEFRECPAFTPVEFMPLDTQYRTLRAVLTCRHLDAGESAEGAFYPRCALGTESERRTWVARVGSDTLERLREVGLEYRAWVRPLLAEAWERKASLLAAREAGEDTGAQTAELERAVTALIQSATAWVQQHRQALDEVGLEPPALLRLLELGTRAWAEADSAGLDYQIPDDLLEQFSEPVQQFIRSGR